MPSPWSEGGTGPQGPQGPQGATGAAAPKVLILYPLLGVTSLTSGAGSIKQEETATNKQNTDSVQFAQGGISYWEEDTELPGWTGGTITATYVWFAASASTNPAVWGIQGRAYSDGAVLDDTWGTAVEVTDANNGNGDVNISVVSGPVTLAGAVGGTQHVQLRGYRKGTGADTLAATAKLLYIRIDYT